MTKLNGSTFKDIIGLDSAIEKLVGEEVNSCKEINAETFKFKTDNFVVEVHVSVDLYEGMTVQSYDIEAA